MINYYVKYNRPEDGKYCTTSDCKTKGEAELIAVMLARQGCLNVEVVEIRYR